MCYTSSIYNLKIIFLSNIFCKRRGKKILAFLGLSPNFPYLVLNTLFWALKSRLKNCDFSTPSYNLDLEYIYLDLCFPNETHCWCADSYYNQVKLLLLKTCELQQRRHMQTTDVGFSAASVVSSSRCVRPCTTFIVFLHSLQVLVSTWIWELCRRMCGAAMRAVRCSRKVSATRRLCSLGKLRQKSGFFVEHFKPFCLSPDTYFAACAGSSLIKRPVCLPSSRALALRNNEFCSDALNNALLSRNLQIMPLIQGLVLGKQEKKFVRLAPEYRLLEAKLLSWLS